MCRPKSSALLALMFVVSACGVDASSLDEACSTVASATSIGVPSVTEFVADPELQAQALEALDRAHAATDQLSRRERNRLVEDCTHVSAISLERFRTRNSQHVAANLIRLEDRLKEAAEAIEVAAEQERQADEEYPRTASVACTSLERSQDIAPESARFVLADLNSMIFRQRLWLERHWDQFEQDCPLVLELSIEEVVASLTEIVAIQDEVEAQNESMEMFTVLAEMERAWNSVSASDRAVICSRFRQNGVATAQEWIQAAGYGKPEWAFVFLTQAC